MKIFRLTKRLPSFLLSIAAASATTQPALAVQLSTYVTQPSQGGTGSAFYLGHTVMASTPFNVLNAGGAFTAQCNHPATLPMTGERALGSNTWGIERNMLTVTIPAQQPAVRNVSGWLQVPGDTTLLCNYRWTSFATEGGYSIGVGGFGITFGNESAREGGTVDFTIYRPPREDADGGCVP
jgi:hypothetical protein